MWRWAAGPRRPATQSAASAGQRHWRRAAILLTAVWLVRLAVVFEPIAANTANDVTFLAPVQQAASALTAEVANVPANRLTFAYGGSLMLALFAAAFWIYGWLGGRDSLPRILGWTFLAWAALRLPNGAPAFIAVIAAFLLLHRRVLR